MHIQTTNGTPTRAGGHGRPTRRRRTVVAVAGAIAIAATALSVVPTAEAATFAPPTWKQTIGHPGHAGVYAWGMATAKDGSILVGDYWNYSIRRFSAAGSLLQTIGSKGTGPGEIMGTHGLAVDPRDGAIYHADMNHPWQIQKWSADGTYLSSFGTYVFGKTVPYPYITRIAVDSQGVIYGISSHNVPSTFKSVVMKWNPDGTFNSSWGANGPALGELGLMHGIAIGPNDDVYLVDTTKKVVQVFSKDGVYLRSFGAGRFGGDLRGITIDAPRGWVYVVDAAASQIEKFTISGTWLASFGSEGTGAGQFRDGGREVTVDAAGNVHAADFGNNRVNVFGSGGAFKYSYPSPALPPPDDGFNQPQGVAVNPGGTDVYTADTYNHRVQRWTPTGTFVSKWGFRGTKDPYAMNYPRGIAVDPRNRDVVLLNSREGNVKRYTRAGTFVSSFGSWGTGTGQFNLPRGIAVGADGRIAVADSINKRVQMFTATGTLMWTAPCGIGAVTGKGPGLLGGCTGVTFDAAGNLYAAAVTENKIYKWTGAGTPITTWGTLGTAPGQLKGPYGVAVHNGLLYVTESNNDRVSVWDLDGVFQGVFGKRGTGDGQFNRPRDLSIDNAGRMYITDSQNEHIDVFQIG